MIGISLKFVRQSPPPTCGVGLIPSLRTTTLLGSLESLHRARSAQQPTEITYTRVWVVLALLQGPKTAWFENEGGEVRKSSTGVWHRGAHLGARWWRAAGRRRYGGYGATPPYQQRISTGGALLPLPRLARLTRLSRLALISSLALDRARSQPAPLHYSSTVVGSSRLPCTDDPRPGSEEWRSHSTWKRACGRRHRTRSS